MCCAGQLTAVCRRLGLDTLAAQKRAEAAAAAGIKAPKKHTLSFNEDEDEAEEEEQGSSADAGDGAGGASGKKKAKRMRRPPTPAMDTPSAAVNSDVLEDIERRRRRDNVSCNTYDPCTASVVCRGLLICTPCCLNRSEVQSVAVKTERRTSGVAAIGIGGMTAAGGATVTGKAAGIAGTGATAATGGASRNVATTGGRSRPRLEMRAARCAWPCATMSRLGGDAQRFVKQRSPSHPTQVDDSAAMG